MRRLLALAIIAAASHPSASPKSAPSWSAASGARLAAWVARAANCSFDARRVALTLRFFQRAGASARCLNHYGGPSEALSPVGAPPGPESAAAPRAPRAAGLAVLGGDVVRVGDEVLARWRGGEAYDEMCVARAVPSPHPSRRRRDDFAKTASLRSASRPPD